MQKIKLGVIPISDNFEAAAAVVKAGKHLIAEKPLAATMEEARKLRDLMATASKSLINLNRDITMNF